MSDQSAPLVPTSVVPDSSSPTARKTTLGDRIRHLAQQLRQEDQIQIKATSRILGAAAQLAENHDRLIDEVVEMVEEDLDQQAPTPQAPTPPQPYTVEQLQQQFGKFSDAKAHFGIKAASWAALVDKLNQPWRQQRTDTRHPSPPSAPSPSRSPSSQDAVLQRLEAIEREIQTLRGEMAQVLSLLKALGN
ncbi:hypothetical protein [Egbenema bharatensis]|uniref:hypothetical protein n=1 Tax=Egbenema bharatensis TaxID=3463334 RepID=UPI003A838904